MAACVSSAAPAAMAVESPLDPAVQTAPAAETSLDPAVPAKTPLDPAGPAGPAAKFPGDLVATKMAVALLDSQPTAK